MLIHICCSSEYLQRGCLCDQLNSSERTHHPVQKCDTLMYFSEFLENRGGLWCRGINCIRLLDTQTLFNSLLVLVFSWNLLTKKKNWHSWFGFCHLISFFSPHFSSFRDAGGDRTASNSHHSGRCVACVADEDGSDRGPVLNDYYNDSLVQNTSLKPLHPHYTHVQTLI